MNLCFFEMLSRICNRIIKRSVIYRVLIGFAAWLLIFLVSWEERRRLLVFLPALGYDA